MPPLAGFVGKLEIFTAAIDADMAWLAVTGIIATVISLYPYLRVIAPAVLEEPLAEWRRRAARPSLAAAAVIATVATVGIGVGAEPFLEVAKEALPILPSGALPLP